MSRGYSTPEGLVTWPTLITPFVQLPSLGFNGTPQEVYARAGRGRRIDRGELAANPRQPSSHADFPRAKRGWKGEVQRTKGIEADPRLRYSRPEKTGGARAVLVLRHHVKEKGLTESSSCRRNFVVRFCIYGENVLFY